uniref:5'-nucleotidase n=1 Tax=Hadrurus spadix TaxID=141984 RepID=A0A1W7RA44_9SCOR
MPLLVIFAFVFSPTVYAFNLTILHTNDVHSRFEQFNAFGSRCTESYAQKGECFGGVARQATKVKEFRQKYPNSLFLSAGDYYQGTFMYTVHKWKIVADFMNQLGHDVMAFGNHEFDDGIEGLVPLLENVEFPIISCNINASREPSMKEKVPPFVIKEVDGHKIGIIGYTTPDTMFLSRTGNLVFTDEIACIKDSVKLLKGSGVKIIIALGHSGFPKDIEIAEAVEDVDIVVGGHTDTFLYTGTPPSTEKPQDEYPTVITHTDGTRTLVVQDFTFGKYMGFLNVQFDNEGNVQNWEGNPILLDNSVKQDPVILNALQPYIDKVSSLSTQTVGKTKVLLRGDRLICRMEECNMGNMLSDALVDYFKDFPTNYGWTPAAIGIWNSGGIRSSVDETIGQGNITMEDIMNVAPFSNTYSTVELKGEDLYTMMEESVSEYDPSAIDPPGKFLQISGLKVWYNTDKSPFQRVSKLHVRCAKCRVPRYQDVDKNAIYNLIVPIYLLNGGDGFKVFKEKAISVHNSGILDTDIIQTYLDRHSTITTGIEERITFICGGPSDEHNSTTLKRQIRSYVRMQQKKLTKLHM